ncbi:MAG TPA: RelA/SpoT domain-containing protein [Pyrinomonadaceae bacterium]|nr:RelA/SpoT domain-containing protein [Pyrinomonadaceae bacterium]
MLPSSDLTKSQVDRLGDRLRKGDISDDDLRLLDSYRRSFSDAYEDVVGQIRDRLELEPTGRPAKSTTSIVEKLSRESIRLSQMQDIAGCRLIVSDIATQDEVVRRVTELFHKSILVDRREQPSHGYRAVHLIAHMNGKLIEIQVRTLLQHLWAELSEKLSDVVDKAIKYGGGERDIASPLLTVSENIKSFEGREKPFQELVSRYAQARSKLDARETDEQIITMDREVEEARKVVNSSKQEIIEGLNALIAK